MAGRFRCGSPGHRDGAPNLKRHQDTTIELSAFEPRHLDGVVALLCSEYGGDLNERRRQLSEFYDHPYQRDRCVRVVALSGETVLGFQSLFFWPLWCQGRQITALQSGNSVISREARGQGLFGRLLRHQETLLDPARVDCLIGFPVDASLGGFLRCGWTHVVDLAWHGRIISPLSAIRQLDVAALERSFETTGQPIDGTPPPVSLAVASTTEFCAWRSTFRHRGTHYYFHFNQGQRDIRFDLRLELRGRMKVLVIGGIVATGWSPELVREGLRRLLRAARATGTITLIALAWNEQAHGKCRTDDWGLARLLRRNLFVRLPNKIHFIVKPLTGNEASFLDPDSWQLFRGDIDTW